MNVLLLPFGLIVVVVVVPLTSAIGGGGALRLPTPGLKL
jgi:hypothetical protein